MSFAGKIKDEISEKTPKARHCKLALLAGLSGEYKDAALSKDCCRRAYLKGAFLASGSVSDPNKAYHFEIVVSTKEYANWLTELIREYGVDAKVSKRKENFIVYVKDASGISDMLNLIEAHVAMMEFENVRILKEVRNSVNRQVNCDIANNGKTIAAAARQIQDIEYIEKKVGLHTLKPELAELARLRLENSDAPLKDLGMMLTNRIGKSGVNHRLAKLCEIAEGLRKQDSEAESAVVSKEEI